MSFTISGIAALVLLGACGEGGDDATVIEVVDVSKTTTSTTEPDRLEYTAFPELGPEEDALCSWIGRTNRTLDRLETAGSTADANHEITLRGITLSDPQRVFAIRDHIIGLNGLQSEGYAAIASGADVALEDSEMAAFASAHDLVDRIASFNEDLADLEDQSRVDAVAERQAETLPSMVDRLEGNVAAFNQWAWPNCVHGGIKTLWDDFIPYEIDDED